MLLLTKIVLAFTILGNISLLVLVLWHGSKNALNRLLALQVLCITGWTAAIFLNLWLESVIVEQWIFAWAALLLTAQIWFISVFPERRLPKPGVLAYATLLIGLFFFCISFVPGTLFHQISVTEQGYTILDMGRFSILYSLFALIYVLAPIAILFRKLRRAPHGIIKEQLRHLMLGFVIFALVNILTNSILPVFFGVYFFNALGPTFSLILAGFILYTITRHHFLDIRLVIQRGLIYATLLGMVIGLYLFVISLLGYLFEYSKTAPILWSAGIVTMLGIFGVPVLAQRFGEWTDPIFFKGKYSYRNATRELSEIINRNIDPDVLFVESTAALGRILKVTHVHIVLQRKGEDKKVGPILESDMRHLHAWHKSERIITSNACFPYCPIFDHATNTSLLRQEQKEAPSELAVLLLLDSRLLGTVLLGEKLSGDAYTDEDYALLENFSAQFAVALEKATLYGRVKKHTKELGQKVAERTREIAQMREAEKQMMVEIAHGLQTPLTVLKTEIGRLKHSVDDALRLNAFETSVDMVSKFIYDLLTLARLESAPETIVLEKIDLSDLIREIVEYVSTTAESEHITVTSTIADPVLVLGNKTKLNEAMINLLSNAVKYMGDNAKREISVTLKTEHDDAVIVVSDTGIGIDPEDLPRIFSRFYRAKQPAPLQKSGTGLGLAITKMIVGRHNGTIVVENNEGGGVRFTIRIPLAD